MPASPYNFVTLAASSQVKLLGCNVIQAPQYTGAGIQYDYGTMFTSWTTGNAYWSNWIQPQIKNMHRLGVNICRCILGGDAVLSGAITQGQFNSRVLDIINYVRSLGMTLGCNLLACNVYGSIGSPSSAALWAVSKSLLDNVLVPNQDIVAYFEPHNQETETVDVAISNGVTTLLRADPNNYTIPIAVSVGSEHFGDWPSYTTANYDLFNAHYYPEFTAEPLAFVSAKNEIYSALATINRPIFVEETGYGYGSNGAGLGVTAQDRADWFAYVLESAFGHPSVVGVCFWSGAASDITDNVAGNWGCFDCPAPYNPNATNPATDWAQQVGARQIAAWGTPNRNLSYVVSLNGSQAVTTTPTALNVNAATRASSGSITNWQLGTKFWSTTPISLIGTATITGDAGTTYTVDLFADDFQNAGNSQLIGSASRVGGGTLAINISGNITTGDIFPQVRGSRGAGVDGSITALSGTMVIGNAPALSPPRATPVVL